MTNFHIDATDLQWLEGMDERQDHCLHGHGMAVIGERTLEYDCNHKQQYHLRANIGTLLLPL